MIQGSGPKWFYFKTSRGKIWAESGGDGQGTTFIFSLPMEPPKENNNINNSNPLPLGAK